MTLSVASTRPRPYFPLLTLIVPLGCLFWAYGSTFLELSQSWKANPQYSHGYLVPVFALALLWLRRDRLDVKALRPSLWGLPLVAAALALRLWGVYYYYVWLDPISLIPCLLGLTLLLGGWAALRWAWPSVLFLAFMVPLPYRLASALSGPLQRLATVVSTFVMQVLGLPALSEGNVILLNEAEIGVVEACSGLRMLVVFFALATAVALVSQRRFIDKVVLVLSAIPIALISNILRVTATGILHEMVDSATANAFFHDVAGWLMMPLALAMLALELKVMSHLFIEMPTNSSRSRIPGPRRSPMPAGPRPRQAPPPLPRPRERARSAGKTSQAKQT
jgi:exosortase